jgi:outer membrane receptor protein involved in Fe transport
MGVGIAPLWASDGTGLISDDVNWVKGNHALAIGALYMFGIKRQTVFTTPQGAFGFSGAHTGDPAADYLLGLDATFSQSSTKNLGYFHYRQGEAYVQDDWHATPRLTLNAGLRWQYFSADTESGNHVTSFDPALYNPAEAPVVNPNGSLQINSLNQPVTASGEPANLLNGLAFAGENGVPSGFFVPVKTNFGPRLGFAYDVLGNGKTAIRGGYGIGYTRIPIETMYDAFGQNPPNNQSANVLNSLISDGVIGTAAAPTTQTLENVPFNFKAAQIQSYNLTLEQQIKPSMVATIAYAGSQSRHLETSSSGSYDMNFPLPVSAPSASGCLAPGQPAASSYDFDPCINAGISSEDYTRPYQGYSLMGAEFDEGESNYNALQSGLNYHVGGSQFSIAYTWSKTLATLGARVAGTPYAQLAAAQNMRDWHAEYGPPSYDFTNDFTATWVYPIPSFDRGRRLLAATLDGWNFAGLALLQSGFAMSPAMGLGTSGLAARPNQVAPYQKVGRHDEWFNTSSFAAPEYGFFGDARNGTIRGPGYTAVNVGLYKTFPIVSRFNAEFRAEAFNIANHPNFETVDTGLGDGSYGQVTSAGDPRILELALKLNF